jgi:16S rRNA (uracil1498-N3)-methyltransferase
MSLKSVYFPAADFDNDLIRVTGDEHRHLAVARVEDGETIEVFDGKGTVWTAEIKSQNRRETLARVIQKRHVERESHDVMLGLSLVRLPAFELALEKAVEVGVTRIIPVVAGRSNVKPGHREERWLRILVEAAKQSKRYHLPKLEEPVTVDGILSLQARSKIVFAERGGGPLQSAVAGSPVLYVVGPEGGWTEAERDAFERSGFKPVWLGPGVLKTETAAIVGAALIRYELQSR